MNDGQRMRFREVSARYASLADRLSGGRAAGDGGDGGYDWSSRCDGIRRAFREGVPFDFLNQPDIRYTMVHNGPPAVNRLKHRLITTHFSEAESRLLLEEDDTGCPSRLEEMPCTSGNRLHHASHLAFYRAVAKRDIADTAVLIEWGGGYGNMARIVRRLNPALTYIIIDLPELGALQYIYLYAVTGEAPHIMDPGSEPVPGRISLVSSPAVVNRDVRLTGTAFLSTWALTESTAGHQRFVVAEDFFGADALLLAYATDGNLIRDVLPDRGCTVTPLPYLDGHHYAFR